METRARHVVELRAGGPDDPDGMRTATVLSAYFHAERTKAIRRLLWQWMAILAGVWLALALTTALLSRGAILAGFVLFGALAASAALIEWRAGRRLSALLADVPASARVLRN